MGHLSSIRNAWRQRPRVTARGWAVAGTAISGVVVGVGLADAILVQIGLFLALLWGLSMILCYRNLSGVTVSHDHAPTAFVGEVIDLRVRVHCEGKAACGLEIADELWNPAGYARALDPQEGWPFAEVLCVVEVTAGSSVDAVPAVLPKAAGTTATPQLTARCRKRGVIESFRACLSSEFPFGLFRRSVLHTINQGLTVYPKPLPVPELDPWLLGGQGGDHGLALAGREMLGDFRGMREFGHGDALRLIHWPLSARFGELVVREFESSPLQDTLLLFHSCQASGRRRHFSGERALAILTGICCAFYDRTLPLTVCTSFNNWEHLLLDNQAGSLECLLCSFAKARILSSTDFRPLIRAVHEAPEQQRVVVVSNIPMRHWASTLPLRQNLILLDERLRPILPGLGMEVAV